MPFENLYFYDDSIISTEPFQEGNLIHIGSQEKPRGVEAPGVLVCTWMKSLRHDVLAREWLKGFITRLRHEHKSGA